MIQKLRNVSMWLALAAVLLGVPTIAQSQTLLNTTTITNAIDNNQRTFIVGSTANIVVGYRLFLPQTGESMFVTAIPVSGTVTTRRGAAGPYGATAAPASATVVIVSNELAAVDYTPTGACTRGSGPALYSPLVNYKSGMLFVCRSSLWQGTSLTLITYNSTAPFTP